MGTIFVSRWEGMMRRALLAGSGRSAFAVSIVRILRTTARCPAVTNASYSSSSRSAPPDSLATSLVSNVFPRLYRDDFDRAYPHNLIIGRSCFETSCGGSACTQMIQQRLASCSLQWLSSLNPWAQQSAKYPTGAHHIAKNLGCPRHAVPSHLQVQEGNEPAEAV